MYNGRINKYKEWDELKGKKGVIGESYEKGGEEKRGRGGVEG